nr:hypothetical protein [Zoogloea dura]
MSFECGLYSVPFALVGKRLWLRATDSVVTVHRDFQPAAIYARSLRPGERRTVVSHLPPEAQTFFAHDRIWCLQQAAGVGPACAGRIRRLLSDRISERLPAALYVPVRNRNSESNQLSALNPSMSQLPDGRQCLFLHERSSAML